MSQGLCANHYEQLLQGLDSGFLSHSEAVQRVGGDTLSLRHRLHELRRKGYRIATITEGRVPLGYVRWEAS